MKNICVLGSTGSIGKNSLDVIRRHPAYFSATILAVNKNITLLAEQIQIFKPRHVIIYDPASFKEFKRMAELPGCTIWLGNEGLVAALSEDPPDLFVNAFVGFAGLEPTREALRLQIPVALANKETLVIAGAYITKLARDKKISLVPIDSEHSAIWQCLAGEEKNVIRRLILTASGGPFRTKPVEEFQAITPEQALQHPNWSMGSKITIDSATLMNKGLEVIEAFWLYPVSLENIDVVIHPQSIIHSMVEFEDRSVKAQLGLPDMRIPIQYALSYPERLPIALPAIDFQMTNMLTFEKPDQEKFPCLGLAYQTLRAGVDYPAVLNAANEVAVAAFLEKKIKFTDIPSIIKTALDEYSGSGGDDFEHFLEIDRTVRKKTAALIKKY